MDERTLHPAVDDQRGFTLIELLVVILIIGILAAIAIPVFLGQANKAHDTNAKADVRNAVSQMESCYRSEDRYSGCPDDDHPVDAVDVTILGGGATYVAEMASATGTTFTITRSAASYVRSCDRPDSGGCRSDSSW